MVDESYTDKLTPGELFAAGNYRPSVVDPRKSRAELSGPELLLLEMNPDELERYNRDRAKYLFETQQEATSDEPTIGELIRELYGKKN